MFWCRHRDVQGRCGSLRGEHRRSARTGVSTDTLTGPATSKARDARAGRRARAKPSHGWRPRLANAIFANPPLPVASRRWPDARHTRLANRPHRRRSRHRQRDVPGPLHRRRTHPARAQPATVGCRCGGANRGGGAARVRVVARFSRSRRAGGAQIFRAISCTLGGAGLAVGTPSPGGPMSPRAA